MRLVFRKTVVGDWRFDYLSGSHLQRSHLALHLTLKMTTDHVVETSVTNNSLPKDYSPLDDQFKLFIIITYLLQTFSEGILDR